MPRSRRIRGSIRLPKDEDLLAVVGPNRVGRGHRRRLQEGELHPAAAAPALLVAGGAGRLAGGGPTRREALARHAPSHQSFQHRNGARFRQTAGLALVGGGVASNLDGTEVGVHLQRPGDRVDQQVDVRRLRRTDLGAPTCKEDLVHDLGSPARPLHHPLVGAAVIVAAAVDRLGSIRTLILVVRNAVPIAVARPRRGSRRGGAHRRRRWRRRRVGGAGQTNQPQETNLAPHHARIVSRFDPRELSVTGRGVACNRGGVAHARLKTRRSGKPFTPVWLTDMFAG
jgi:hypothetical protein